MPRTIPPSIPPRPSRSDIVRNGLRPRKNTRNVQDEAKNFKENLHTNTATSKSPTETSKPQAPRADQSKRPPDGPPTSSSSAPRQTTQPREQGGKPLNPGREGAPIPAKPSQAHGAAQPFGTKAKTTDAIASSANPPASSRPPSSNQPPSARPSSLHLSPSSGEADTPPAKNEGAALSKPSPSSEPPSRLLKSVPAQDSPTGLSTTPPNKPTPRASSQPQAPHTSHAPSAQPSSVKMMDKDRMAQEQTSRDSLPTDIPAAQTIAASTATGSPEAAPAISPINVAPSEATDVTNLAQQIATRLELGQTQTGTKFLRMELKGDSFGRGTVLTMHFEPGKQLRLTFSGADAQTAATHIPQLQAAMRDHTAVAVSIDIAANLPDPASNQSESGLARTDPDGQQRQQQQNPEPQSDEDEL